MTQNRTDNILTVGFSQGNTRACNWGWAVRISTPRSWECLLLPHRHSNLRQVAPLNSTSCSAKILSSYKIPPRLLKFEKSIVSMPDCHFEVEVLTCVLKNSQQLTVTVRCWSFPWREQHWSRTGARQNDCSGLKLKKKVLRSDCIPCTPFPTRSPLSSVLVPW